jgi:alginate O-acetyltransferase complex protein AlgI
MVTMLVSALWHNVGLAMLMWGVLHGIYLIFERFRALYFRSKPPQQQPVWRQGIAMASVFVLAVFAWIPFRATSPEDALDYVARLLYMSGEFDWGFHLHILVFVVLIITLIIDVVEYHWGETAYRFLPTFPQAVLLSLVLIMIVLVLTARSDTPPPFIYQGF